MVSKNLILGILPAFQNRQSVILENQNVTDIITGILNTHSKYEKQYDKIYKYFVGADLEDTCRNIFNFLKAHVPYFIESNEFQFLKSPASIVSTKGDCKSYALFSCGILDALRRNEDENIEVSYRFASYDPFNKTPEHVFCVVRGYGNEFWIDPVLDRFNQRKDPYFYKDKKLNTMALVGLSGVNSDNEQIGSIDWGNLLNTFVQSAPAIITATSGNKTSTSSAGNYFPTTTTASTGISTNTLLMIGGAGLLVFLLMKK